MTKKTLKQALLSKPDVAVGGISCYDVSRRYLGKPGSLQFFGLFEGRNTNYLEIRN